ncbi:hypothetical protein, partial [Xanthomonas campestris]|uniref:hypothetical protein n=1 Tax=Xanthomonas campestris TaxID=339 RepID=UPI002AD268DF
MTIDQSRNARALVDYGYVTVRRGWIAHREQLAILAEIAIFASFFDDSVIRSAIADAAIQPSRIPG